MPRPWSTTRALGEVSIERGKQDARWGEQNHPDGTGEAAAGAIARFARARCDRKAKEGTITWADILAEEFFEARAESDPEKLREELIQVAAVAVAWVEAIDRRKSNGAG